MNDTSYGKSSNFTELAVGLVAAYVANNPVPASEVPALIARVYGAIAALASGAVPTEGSTAAPAAVDKPSAAQIRKSVQHDGIVSFIDGKTYKTLKRHLTANGLSPQSYRERYGLPTDYPMVAPSYAEQRSALAKAIGLGQPGAMADRERKGRKAA
jgi:predicted transcriptional regulator